MVARSLSSGVPAGITMLVFCDHTESENSAMQIRIKSWRWMTRILHLEETCWAARQKRAIAQCDAKLPARSIRKESYCFCRVDAMRYRTVQSEIDEHCGRLPPDRLLPPPFALLRHHQPARRGQQHCRNQAVAFQLQCSIAHLLQV